MGNDTKIYCISLSKVDEYLRSDSMLSDFPLNKPLAHSIRQIVDVAMCTFDELNLTIPALPETFSIDRLYEGFEDGLRLFFKECLLCDTEAEIKVNFSYHSEYEMTISLG